MSGKPGDPGFAADFIMQVNATLAVKSAGKNAVCQEGIGKTGTRENVR